MVSVDVLLPPDDSVTLVGFRLSVGPVGELDAVSVTVPLKLLRLFSVIVEVACALASAVTVDGLELIEKSAGCDGKNCDIADAAASLPVIVARPQFVSIVFVKK